MHHEKNKYIDICFHFIREYINNEDVQMSHMTSLDQAVDIFTKTVSVELFNNCKIKFGMKDERDLS
jgi:hypothetical protein